MKDAKALDVFPSLNGFDPIHGALLLNELQQLLIGYNVALTRFESYNLDLKEVGFAAPGIGYKLYVEMGRKGFDILAHHWRQHEPDQRIQSLLQSITATSGSLWTFLDRLFTQIIPLFDVAHLVPPPSWNQANQSFAVLAQHVQFYMHVMDIRGTGRATPALTANVFLELIDRTDRYYALVVLKKDEIKKFTPEQSKLGKEDKRDLPEDLRLDGLVSIFTHGFNASSPAHIPTRPVVNQVDGRQLEAADDVVEYEEGENDRDYTNPGFFAGLMCVECDDNGATITSNGIPCIQGFAQTNQATTPHRNPRRLQTLPAASGQPYATRSQRPYPTPTSERPNATANRSPSSGASTRPILMCGACGKRGHTAATCDYLAMMWICREWEKAGNHTRDIRDAVRRWKIKYGEFGHNRIGSPRKVYQTFLEVNNLTQDQLGDQLDFASFAESQIGLRRGS